MELYWLLSGDRYIGMGVAGGIPTAGIMAMVSQSGMSALDFLYTIREMDAVFLEHVNRKK